MTISRLTLTPLGSAPKKLDSSVGSEDRISANRSVDETETIDVTSIAMLAQGDRWRTEAMRSYDRPVLIWFTRGQGRITIAGRTGGYGSHSAVFLPPGTMHGFTVTPAVLGSVLRLTRKNASLMPQSACHFRIREVHQQRELTGLIDSIDHEFQRAESHRDHALNNLESLLAVWFSRFSDIQTNRGLAEQSGNAAHRLTEAYTALVEREFDTPVGVQHFAQLLGVTPTHLSRACREASGRPALEILKERRHFEACRLLRDTNIPIADIARQTGFTSAAYFTRAFRSSTGKSPSQFRSSK